MWNIFWDPNRDNVVALVERCTQHTLDDAGVACHSMNGFRWRTLDLTATHKPAVLGPMGASCKTPAAWTPETQLRACFRHKGRGNLQILCVRTGTELLSMAGLPYFEYYLGVIRDVLPGVGHGVALLQNGLLAVRAKINVHVWDVCSMQTEWLKMAWSPGG